MKLIHSNRVLFIADVQISIEKIEGLPLFLQSAVERGPWGKMHFKNPLPDLYQNFRWCGHLTWKILFLPNEKGMDDVLSSLYPFNPSTQRLTRMLPAPVNHSKKAPSRVARETWTADVGLFTPQSGLFQLPGSSPGSCLQLRPSDPDLWGWPQDPAYPAPNGQWQNRTNERYPKFPPSSF